MNEKTYQEIEDWLNKVVYFDEGVRRPIHFDDRRNRVFFFADPLDFDKDDQKVARYWIDECEGYNGNWNEDIIKHCD